MCKTKTKQNHHLYEADRRDPIWETKLIYFSLLCIKSAWIISRKEEKKKGVKDQKLDERGYQLAVVDVGSQTHSLTQHWPTDSRLTPYNSHRSQAKFYPTRLINKITESYTRKKEKVRTEKIQREANWLADVSYAIHYALTRTRSRPSQKTNKLNEGWRTLGDMIRSVGCWTGSWAVGLTPQTHFIKHTCQNTSSSPLIIKHTS